MQYFLQENKTKQNAVIVFIPIPFLKPVFADVSFLQHQQEGKEAA